MPRTSYIACVKCMRIFNRKRLIEQMGRLECPYCGSTRFTESFSGVIMILEPEESMIAKKVNKNEKGIFALSIEIF